MGLFDTFRQSNLHTTQVSLGPAESFMALMLLVVASDGYLADDETGLLGITLERMQLFRSYPADAIRKMLDKLCGLLRREGSDALFHAALETLPHDLYDTAFAIATDLVLSDGQVSEEEEDLLNNLCQALKLPESLAKQVIQVMIIKNKG